MKQKTNLMRRATLLLLTMLCSLTGAWADELTVYEGTTTSTYVPAYVYYFDDFSRSQFVIPADDLSAMAGGTISSLKFYTTQNNVPYTTESTVDVYLMEVGYTTMTGLEPKANGTIVYQGTLNFVSEGQGGSLTIEFTTPYTYNGGNLLIGIENTTDVGFRSIYFYGQTVNGASWAGYDSSSLDGVTGDQRNFIPKTTFEYSFGVVYDKPTNLTVTGITSNSAWISWETRLEDNATGFTYKYKKTTEEAWSTETDILATQTQLTGLTPNTDYIFCVKAHYADGESGYATINFTTTVSFPYSQDFSGSGIPAGWSRYSGLLADVMNGTSLSSTESGWSNGTSNGALDGNHLYSNIYGTSRKSWIVTPAIPLGSNARLVFDVAYTAYSGTAADPQTTGNDDKFAVLISTDNMATWTILRQWDNAGSEYVLNNLTPSALSVTIDLSAYTGQNAVVAFYAESTVANADNNIHVDNVVFEDKPSCEKPTSLAVNYTGGTTAQVSWTSDADAWQLAFVDGEGTITSVYNVTENPYTLTGLELATTYKLAIRTDCGSGSYSEWTSLTNPVTFSTGLCMPEDQKEITYELADSYGDGWDGAAINVVHVNTGTVVATLTLASGSSETTGTVNLCCGEDYSFEWKAGNYDYECSYAFYDVNEEEIFSGNGTMSDAVNYTMVCTVIPWKTPTNLKASEIGPRSVKLSWTERSNPAATAWVVAYKSATDADFTEVNVTTNPFTLTGLTPETAYTVKVRPATNEVVKWSDEITFVTNIAAPSPTDLSVTPFVTTADVSWNGFAESYDVEWRENSVLEPSADALWLQYDNGTIKSVVGGSSANEWTWGVMYPANMLGSINTLTKIAFYEADNSYFTNGSITVNVYSGGDNAPGTLIGTETIATTGTEEMREVSLSNPIEFDATQNLWITLTTNATYCMGMSEQDGGINSRWYFDGESWVDFGTVYTKGAAYSFMIRGFVDNVDLSSISWTTAEDVTSPYTIEGLDSETDYAVRVRGDFGADGESIWASTSFTTKSVNDIPIDLAATDITPTSAKLKWTGYQDSFNLKYRHSVTVDPSIPATVILTAGDIWGDGTGYQMLLDADATAYGTIIPTEGGLTTNGDASDETYAEFEYKIPTNADGAMDTENVVFDNSVAIQIPAGTYDWCITNPSPGDRVWIASSNGVGGRYDDFVFEPGVTYEFTVANYGNFDGVDLTVTPVMGEWTAVDNVTNPYTLSGLTPDTAYEWQVQGNLTSGTTAWSEVASFTTLSLFSGDVNGDGNRSITDAVAIVNYVLGNPPAGFIAAAADVNGDGKIDISDAVAVVNIVLNKTGK